MMTTADPDDCFLNLLACGSSPDVSQRGVREGIRVNFTSDRFKSSIAAMLAVGALALGGSIAAAPASALDSVQASDEVSAQRITIAAEPGSAIAQSTIEELVAKNNLTLVETQTFYTHNGTTLTIGVPTGTHEPLKEAIGATLTDLAGAQDGRTAADAEEMAALIASAKTELAAGAEVHQIVVESSGDKVDLPATLSVVETPAESEQSASAAAACGTWYPTFSSNTAATSSAGGRYNSLKFSWSAARLSALHCTGSSTFEPDLVTYNYDGLYYFSSTMLAWATTMPAGYWDTNFLDAPEERVYTIGSSNTATMLSSHTYEAYFRMSAGNSSSDSAKVVWQRGYYLWGCPLGPAGCIFAHESVIQFAWNIPLPGSY